MRDDMTLRCDPADQPDEATKAYILQGNHHPVWDYCFNVPDGPTGMWTWHDWSTHVGTNWYRKSK